MNRTSSGAALLHLLALPLTAGLLTSCGKQVAPVRQAPPRTAKADVQEVEALVAAIKQHPSLVDPRKNAGPPIHVDPMPHSAGAHHVMK
jgi:hypothetical protein